MTYQDKIREICTKYKSLGDTGMPVYYLSEDQFQAIFKAVEELVKELIPKRTEIKDVVDIGYNHCVIIMETNAKSLGVNLD